MLQQVQIIGNLGGDPQLNHLDDGTPVTNFSVATNRRWTGRDGEKQEETTWFRISAFGKLAEVATKHLSKGRSVFIQGALRPDKNGNPRTFSRQDGTVGTSFEVNAQTIRFLGSPDDAVDDSGAKAVKEDDEIPF